MKEMIWGTVGLVIALCAAVYLLKLLRLKKKGLMANAEIISVREDKRNTFIHTLRFDGITETYEKDDKSGFSQPFKVGDKRLIIYDPDDPGNFEYEDELKRNIIIVCVMIAVAVVFSVRWLVM